MWRTCSRSKNWNVPPTFPFIFVFLSKLSRQQDSNSDRRSRRRGRWPLDHHHCHQQNWRDRKIRFQQDLNPCSFSHMSSVLLLCCRYCSKEIKIHPRPELSQILFIHHPDSIGLQLTELQTEPSLPCLRFTNLESTNLIITERESIEVASPSKSAINLAPNC